MSTTVELGSKVWEALQLLHGSTTPADVRKQADHFLSKEFPRNKICWDVIDQFLSRSEIPPEGHFFAANTLKRKIYYNISEIPKEGREPFRNRLLEHLKCFGKLGDAKRWKVVVQLAMSYASTALHMPEWTSVINDVLEGLGQPETLVTMLQVLTMLPEEKDNSWIPVAPKIRKELKKKLQASAIQILDVCQKLFDTYSNKPALQKSVLKCFSAWVTLMDCIQPSTLLKSSLFEVPFKAASRTDSELFISADDIFQTAVDSIIGFLKISSRGLREAEAQKNESLHKEWEMVVQRVIPGVLGLRDAFLKAYQDRDEDALKAFSRIFVEIGLRFYDWTVGDSNEANQLLDLMVKVTLYPSQEVAWQSFEFWGDLAEMSFRMRPHQPPTIVKIFTGLVPVMLQVLRRPEDWDELSKDDRSDARQFRYDGVNIMIETNMLIGSEKYLSEVVKVLEAEQQKQSWQGVESCLWVLSKCHSSLGREVMDEQLKRAINDKIKQIFTIIPTASRHHLVCESACPMLAWHSWRFKNDQAVLKSMLAFLTECLDQPKVNWEASRAISKICEDCKESMQPFVKELVNLVYAKKSLKLDCDGQVHIIRGLGIVISQLPAPEATAHFGQLLGLPYEHVKGVLTSNELDQAKLYHAMKRLAEVFKFCTIEKCKEQRPHPVIQALEKIWGEFLKELIRTQLENEDLMEKCTKVIKCCIRTAPDQFRESPVSNDVLKAMTERYMQKPLSCFLYICTIYVDEYGGQESAIPTLGEIFKHLSKKTIPMLPDYNAFVQNPDCVEDYFELLVKYLRRCPHVIMIPETLPAVFACCMKGIGVEHQAAGEAVYKFFLDLFRQTNTSEPDISQRPQDRLFRDRQLVVSLLDAHGNHFVMKLLEGVMEGRSRHGERWHMRLLDQTFEALHTLDAERLKRYMTWGLQNLKDRVAGIPVNPEHPTKDEFFRAFFEAKNRSGRKDAISNFMFSCDRFLMTII